MENLIKAKSDARIPVKIFGPHEMVIEGEYYTNGIKNGVIAVGAAGLFQFNLISGKSVLPLGYRLSAVSMAMIHQILKQERA